MYIYIYLLRVYYMYNEKTMIIYILYLPPPRQNAIVSTKTTFCKDFFWPRLHRWA